MPLTLYSVSDGPPSLAVRMALKALNLDYNLVNVDFGIGEHMTEEYAKVCKINGIFDLKKRYKISNFVEKPAKGNPRFR